MLMCDLGDEQKRKDYGLTVRCLCVKLMRGLRQEGRKERAALVSGSQNRIARWCGRVSSPHDSQETEEGMENKIDLSRGFTPPSGSLLPLDRPGLQTVLQPRKRAH